MMRFLIPLGLFAALVGLFAVGLTREKGVVPSPLIDKPVPRFTVARLREPERMFRTQDLKGQVTLVNVWASWCRECRVEHPFLMDLAKRGSVHIVGWNWKDKRADALAWLAERGDPYDVVVHDADGRAGIDWGVYGVPETFLVDVDGVVRAKIVGPLTPARWQRDVAPVLRQLKESPR